jgi:hypothetical protein
MAQSTVIKSSVFKEDVSLAAGGSGAAETGNRKTSTGGEVTLTKIDAAHIPFRSQAKTVEDLIDGGKDVNVAVNNLTADGTVTLEAMSSAGFVKNSAAGLLSGGNSIAAGDLPAAIDAAKIADGSVSNAEYQYLNGVTSAIQTQFAAKYGSADVASQAEMEAASASNKLVTPGNAKHHPGVGKALAKIIWTAGTPALQAGSVNIASINDDGGGLVTLTFTTEFSSAHYFVALTCEDTAVPDKPNAYITLGGQAVGTLQVQCIAAGGAAVDPTALHVICFGDFA